MDISYTEQMAIFQNVIHRVRLALLPHPLMNVIPVLMV